MFKSRNFIFLGAPRSETGGGETLRGHGSKEVVVPNKSPEEVKAYREKYKLGDLAHDVDSGFSSKDAPNYNPIVLYSNLNLKLAGFNRDIQDIRNGCSVLHKAIGDIELELATKKGVSVNSLKLTAIEKVEFGTKIAPRIEELEKKLDDWDRLLHKRTLVKRVMWDLKKDFPSLLQPQVGGNDPEPTLWHSKEWLSFGVDIAWWNYKYLGGSQPNEE